jgi:PAS domain S-box-containing protein
VAAASPNIVYIFDIVEWRLLYVNQRVESMLGYSLEQINEMGSAFFDEIVHPGDSHRLRALNRRYRDVGDEQILELEFRMRRADGSWRWAHNRTAVFQRDPDGAPTRIIGTIEDVTKKRQAKEAIARAHQELRDVIQHMPDAVMLIRGGRVVFLNTAGIGFFGVSHPEQVVGGDVLDLVHPDERDAARKRIVQLAQTGQPMPPRESRMLRANGDTVPVEVSGGHLIRFEGGQANLIVIRDITERKKFQARLLLADRMASVGTLAAGIAHEINNPLAYVVGNLGYLATRVARLSDDLPDVDVDDVLEACEEARGGAERVQTIVDDLRSFSRVDDQKMGPVDVHSVLESSLKLAGTELERRARVVKSFTPVPPVRASESRLGQVFLNLLVNAIQALPEDGKRDDHEIRLVTRLQHGYVMVEVRDSGPGIPPEIMDHVFDPFFTTKPVGVGTGLGLSICHSLVTTLGGEIHVESETGGGTTFRVLLPADVPPEEPAPAAESGDAQAGSQRKNRST